MDEPLVIRNEDIPALQRVYGIMQEIVSLEKRREWLRERMTSISQHLSDMPHGKGGVNSFDNTLAAVDETEERHRLLVRQYTAELKRAEDIINGLENRNMRTFVRLMYLDNLPAVDVRERLNMTRRGFEQAKHAVEKAKCMKDVVWRDRYILTDGEEKI